MTIRGRIPQLLTECMNRGISVEFSNDFHGPAISWNHYDTGWSGHVHMDDNFSKDKFGANNIAFESALTYIIENFDLLEEG